MRSLHSDSRFLFAITAILMIHSSATAHRGDRVYPAYEVPTSQIPDIHDGSLEDWESALPGASAIPADFESVGLTERSDFTTRLFLAWNRSTGRIYAALQIVDDALLLSSLDDTGEIKTVRDAAAFFVDGDHSGGSYTGTPESFQHQAQRYWAIALGDTTARVILSSPERGWVLDESYTDVGVSVIPGNPYVMALEMYFTPWDGLSQEGEDASGRSMLIPNNIFGFNVLLYDNDTGNSIEGVYSLNGTWAANGRGGELQFTAEAFADVMLIPCDIEDCSGRRSAGSAVRRSSWALIKASLMETSFESN